MTSIETGVDRLVALVEKEKKLELHEAAKQLNVDPAVVQEWAEFLEEEGIVSLEYSLSKTFIVEKRLSKGEVKKKEKEYEGRREAFVRRVDAALKQLEDETAGFESIKKHYDSMKQNIGDEIDAVKAEMEQLSHYENLKKSIDSDILKQKVEYQKTLDDVRSRLLSEERRYKKIVDDIGLEQKKLEQEHIEFSDIKKEEHDLMKRIDALKDILGSVQSRLDSHKGVLDTHEQRLTTLRELADTLKEDIVEKRQKEIEPLLKISTDQSGRILRIQDEIVQKIKSGRDKMQEFESQSKEIVEQFEHFFTKKAKTEQAIQELEKAKLEMKEDLNELIKKAKAFEITSKGDTNAHVKELEGKFQDFDRRRGAFVSQLDYLRQLILGKQKEEKSKTEASQKKDVSTKVESAISEKNAGGKKSGEKKMGLKKPRAPPKKSVAKKVVVKKIVKGRKK